MVERTGIACPGERPRNGVRMLNLLSSWRTALRSHALPRPARNGQSLVEFALVVPLLLLIFSGAADLGRAFYNQVALENAVKEGALFGSRFPLCANPSTLCMDPNTVSWRVQHETRNKTGASTYASLVSPTINECQDPAGVTRPIKECVPGDTYVVRAQLTFDPITPLIGSIVGRITLTSQSNAIVINQAFDPTPGLAPTKLILGTAARNASTLASACTQPDPIGSPGFYRSPCQDSTGALIQAQFREGDTITYKIFVRNNGGTNVTSVTMDDSLGWPASCPVRPTSMPVGGAVYTCTYARFAPVVTGAGTTSDSVNVLTVTGAEILPVTDTATVTAVQAPPDLRVYKYVSVYPLGDDGDGTPNFGFLKTVAVGRVAGSNPIVYYKIAVQNLGGQTAVGFNLTDTNGAPPFGTASCPAKPSSIAAGGTYVCIYPKTFSTDQSLVNTVAVTGTNVTPDSGDTDFATVNVAICSPPLRLVPKLIGLTSVTGPAAWTANGLNGTYTNISSGLVVTQSLQAWSCVAKSTPITVTNAATP
jgi:uncharacterized repeat protein (TIGR01451 family)